MAGRKAKRRNRKKRRPVAKKLIAASWIEQVTGWGRTWWVAQVQGLISKHSKPTKDPWHGRTATEKVVADLVRAVCKTYKKGDRFDENMRMAAVLGQILCLWYARVQRAKCYDPRRPVALGKAAWRGRQWWRNALFDALTDESEDPQYFPGQN